MITAVFMVGKMSGYVRILLSLTLLGEIKTTLRRESALLREKQSCVENWGSLEFPLLWERRAHRFKSGILDSTLLKKGDELWKRER